MNPGEIIHYAVSAASAVICLYVKAELAKQRTEIDKDINRIEKEAIARDNATRWWVSMNYKPLASSGRHQEFVSE